MKRINGSNTARCVKTSTRFPPASRKGQQLIITTSTKEEIGGKEFRRKLVMEKRYGRCQICETLKRNPEIDLWNFIDWFWRKFFRVCMCLCYLLEYFNFLINWCFVRYSQLSMIAYCSCKIISIFICISSLYLFRLNAFVLPFSLLLFFFVYWFIYYCRAHTKKSQFSLASCCGHTAKLLWLFLFPILLDLILFNSKLRSVSCQNLKTKSPPCSRYFVWFLCRIRPIFVDTACSFLSPISVDYTP